MSRSPRVIKDIDTLDQAIKAEQDVESGYHSVIDENLSYWMAVEEDVIESYTKMSEQSDSVEMKRVLQQIVDDSREHRQILDQVSNMLRKIVADETKHAKMLTNLKEHLEGTRGRTDG